MQPAVAQADRWCSCAEQKLLVYKIKANISGECLLSHFCHCVRMFMDAHFVSFSTSFNISFYNLAINPHSRSPNHPVSAAAGSFSVLWLPPAGESLSVQSEDLQSVDICAHCSVSDITVIKAFWPFLMCFHFVYVYMNFLENASYEHFTYCNNKVTASCNNSSLASKHSIFPVFTNMKHYTVLWLHDKDDRQVRKPPDELMVLCLQASLPPVVSPCRRAEIRTQLVRLEDL